MKIFILKECSFNLKQIKLKSSCTSCHKTGTNPLSIVFLSIESQHSKNHNSTHLVLEQICIHIYSKKSADFSNPHSLNLQTVALNTTTCMRIQLSH